MEALDRYIIENSSPESDLLRELTRTTNLSVIQPRMVSGHTQGRLLYMLVRMLRPKSVLEIGTFTGYSALCIAEGLEDGAVLHTVEVDDELEDISTSFFERCDFSDRIKLHIGSALDIAPTLNTTFDLVFIDGDKREYTAYYKMLMGDSGAECESANSTNGTNGTKPLVHSGSILIADNILWSGKVVEPIARNDRHTQDLVDFNFMVVNDPRVENFILPLRDGLSVIRVK